MRIKMKERDQVTKKDNGQKKKEIDRKKTERDEAKRSTKRQKEWLD